MQLIAAQIEKFLAGLPRGALAAVLVAMTLFAVAPAFTSLPPVDRDEARFAQASKQMLETRDFVDIRFQDGPRYKKPAGIYWLQAAAVSLTGQAGDRTIWKYRLPSLAAALLAVLLTARIAAIFGGILPGLWAGALMAGVFVMVGEAHLATTDAALLAAILGAQSVLAGLYVRARAKRFGPEAAIPVAPGEAVLFWASLAASVLIKGPVGIMVVGFTALALALAHRRAAWLGALRPWWGGAGFLLLTMPWFIAISVRSHGAFWAAALGHDLLGKVVSAQESHGAPPGSYLAALWVTFFPASVALALSLAALWRARRLPGLAFAAAWVGPSWIVFELSPTKLIHYVLPLYPGLALAVALVWASLVAVRPRAWQWVAGAVVAAIPPVILGALGILAARLGPVPYLPLAAGGALLGLGGWLGASALRHGQASAAIFGLWIMGVGFAAGSLSALARVPALWPARVIAAQAQGRGICPVRPIVTDGYDEPSLVFLAPGSERATTPAGVAKAMAADPCVLGVVSDTGAFMGAAQALSIAPRKRMTLQAFNIGSGRPVTLNLFTRP